MKCCIFCIQIKIEIEKFKLQGIELEDQRKRILKELEDKQTVSSRDADEYEKKHTEISKILDQLRKGRYFLMDWGCGEKGISVRTRRQTVRSLCSRGRGEYKILNHLRKGRYYLGRVVSGGRQEPERELILKELEAKWFVASRDRHEYKEKQTEIYKIFNHEKSLIFPGRAWGGDPLMINSR